MREDRSGLCDSPELPGLDICLPLNAQGETAGQDRKRQLRRWHEPGPVAINIRAWVHPMDLATPSNGMKIGGYGRSSPLGSGAGSFAEASHTAAKESTTRRKESPMRRAWAGEHRRRCAARIHCRGTIRYHERQWA